MTFDIAPAAQIVSFVLSGILLVMHVKAMLSSGEKKLDERLGKAETKLVEYDRRIQTIEGEMRHMPDRDTAHRLELTMEKISGRLDRLDERLKPIAATSDRLQEFLLDQAQK